MTTEKFRRELRREAEQWWQEGLIDANLYEQLCERYQLRALERDASQRFTAILLGLGSILLGLAAITLVAANWQLWSRPVKLVLLLGLFWGVNAAGFYLWRRSGSKSQRLGHGLLLLGALLLGANLGLMSQMFHQSGPIYELFWVWGLGVIIMAYGLRLASLGLLAWILLQLGYWMGWMSQWDGLPDSPWRLLIQHMPIVAALLFVPLAYRCRSRVLFGLASIAVAMAISTNTLAALTQTESAVGWAVALAFLLPPALLWSYSSRLWRSTQEVDPFVPIARALALWCLGITFSLFAFRVGWEPPSSEPGQFSNWHVAADLAILTIVTGLGWLQLAPEFRLTGYRDRMLHSGAIAGMLLLAFGLLYCHFTWSPLGSLGIVAFNLLLFGLAVGLIRDGLALGSRDAFWGGMGLLVLGIICRMLEYDTGLLLKSLVFALCGAGIIAAGLWFERNAHSSHALPHGSTEEKPL